MNEQILNLAVEAGVINYIDHETPRDYFVHADLDVEDIERFAELILQECIEQVKLELRNNSQLLSNPPQNAGVWDACNNIRRHFGVK